MILELKNLHGIVPIFDNFISKYVSLLCDRLRFEREKQLRQRNSLSSSYERHKSKKSLEEVSANLPINGKSFGVSASLTFDPTVEKRSRLQRKTSKEQTASYHGSLRNVNFLTLTRRMCSGSIKCLNPLRRASSFGD